MPVFADLPDDLPVTLCSAFDWSELRPAERALAGREVRARLARGERPERLAPLACSRGKFRMGRFVDEDGNVYRLKDVAALLEEVPEAREDVRAFRRARAWEVGTAVTVTLLAPVVFATPVTSVPVVLSAPVWLGGGVVATNNNGAARAALARAVTTYNAATFWHATEQAYGEASELPTSVARATELVHGARGCTVDRADPRFAADAALVWAHAERGYDAAVLVQAAEAAPADAGCDLATALPAGLAALEARRAVALSE